MTYFPTPSSEFKAGPRQSSEGRFSEHSHGLLVLSLLPFLRRKDKEMKSYVQFVQNSNTSLLD